MYKEWIWRSVLTLVIVAVTLIGSLAYVAFYATGLSLFQKVVIVLIALIVAGVIAGIIWMTGWSKFMNKKSWSMFKDMNKK